MSKNWRLTEEQKQEAVKLYDAGESTATVAKGFGVSRQSMWDVLHRRTTMRSKVQAGKDNRFYRGGSKMEKAAHSKLEKAIKRGEVTKPDACERCGKTYRFKDGRTAIQGHHEDYTKPLEVIWLCQKCHFEEHRKGVS